MGDTDVDPAIIKRTQDMLGQIINAPALTDKLLNRPPVQFLQDIVKSVIKNTRFLNGLYTEEELSSGYLKEGRENKTLFMKKLVTAVCKYKISNTTKNSFLFLLAIAISEPPVVRVSKILSGHEADKTNLLLQALARAVTARVDNEDVVKRALHSMEENTDDKKSENSRRNEQESELDKSRERDREQKKTSDKERKNDRSREQQDGRRDTSDRIHSSKGERRHKSPEKEAEHSSEQKSSKETRAEQSRRNGERDRHESKRETTRDNENDSNQQRQNRVGDENTQRPVAQDDDESKRNEDNSGRHQTRLPSAKGSRKPQVDTNEDVHIKSTQSISNEKTTTEKVIEEQSMTRPSTARAAISRKSMKTNASDEIASGSGRVVGTQRGQGTLIIETKNNNDDNDNDNDNLEDENFLIQEEKSTIGDRLSKSFKGDDDEKRIDKENDQHGALVKKMIESKQQLQYGSEISTQKTDVKTITQTDAQRRREREKIQKDVDKLQETIQSLTKSIVPLGKMLEYLQEDYEMMAKELKTHTDDYKKTIVELRKEKFITEQSLEPLKTAMLDFDDQIADMKSRIVFMKTKIMTNEKKNAARLLTIIRKQK
ncbi:unnamed protein product [Didymodactylos carnosus]|uniref:Uncharacterized protein n=1 Tax=Didymodactylos carnosus TaxID=1234261 RepID=A0A8S2EPC6_9BILA|nr:unnamed protein product [Didymodactylos carnosus]CAF4073837.1 unnamed protein product [Didymodactylos carnosus]